MGFCVGGEMPDSAHLYYEDDNRIISVFQAFTQLQDVSDTALCRGIGEKGGAVFLQRDSFDFHQYSSFAGLYKKVKPGTKICVFRSDVYYFFTVDPIFRCAGCESGSRCPGVRIYAGSRYPGVRRYRSEEHTSELQSRENLVCRLLLEKKK